MVLKLKVIKVEQERKFVKLNCQEGRGSWGLEMIKQWSKGNGRVEMKDRYEIRYYYLLEVFKFLLWYQVYRRFII